MIPSLMPPPSTCTLTVINTPAPGEQASGSCRQNTSCIWYGGKEMPNGLLKEFDEECSAPFRDQADSSPCPTIYCTFFSTDTDINQILEHLGIWWETSKLVPFRSMLPYLGFHWNLDIHVVHLLGEKKAKYLAAIEEWEAKHTHNLLKTQKLYRKLLHASLVIPSGCAYLTSMEAMPGTFNHHPFLPHTPPQDTPSNLEWWKQQFRKPNISKHITPPQPLVNYEAYLNANSGFGVAITISPR